MKNVIFMVVITMAVMGLFLSIKEPFLAGIMFGSGIACIAWQIEKDSRKGFD